MRLLPAVLVLLLAAAPASADGVMLVDGGPFVMGSDRDSPGEAPQHGLYVGQFYIDRHKVTNWELAAFLNAKGLKSPEGEDYYDRDDEDARIHRGGGSVRAGPRLRGPSRRRGLLVRRPRLLPLEGQAPADRGRVGEGRARE